MRMRSSPNQLHADASSAIREALLAVGLQGPPCKTQTNGDVVVRRPDGSLLTLAVKASALPSQDWVAKLDDSPQRRIIVVADQIPAGVRDELNNRGIAWLDRRGHLRLVGDGVFIDADVPSTKRSSGTRRRSITGRSGLAAAAGLLVRPGDPMSVTEIARTAGMNVSSISRALTTLAELQLAEPLDRGRYRPLVPELFWALADVWPRDRTRVHLTTADLHDPRVGARIEDVEQVGWALGGERGAVSWGAPLVLTGDYPTLMYLPDDEALRVARAIGDNGPPNRPKSAERSAFDVVVDPTGLATRLRYLPARNSLPLTHPLFCALDLTAASRDREALEQWIPPDEFTRVW